MNDLTQLRKTKIQLSDYDYERDIENRLLMAHFTQLDIEILEEILYSSLNVSIKNLARDLEIPEVKLFERLENLSHSRLFTYDHEMVHVDKEMRKYYESQMLKFEEDFKPGMDYLQGLLRKVPIQILPSWYAISRSSNNIFDSIIEKYLVTPHTYQRYLMDLNLGDPILNSIILDVHQSPNLEISSEAIMEKYGLSRGEFEEMMLYLEFNFACCLTYLRQEHLWQEVVTPFHEWKEYLLFLRQTAPTPILTPVQKKSKKAVPDAQERFLNRYHVKNSFSKPFSENLWCEKNLREAEKSIERILFSDWVYFDDFMKGMIAHLSESSHVTLKKTGKSWRYTLPEYSDEERAFLKVVFLEWLPEIGVTAAGTHDGRDCFCVTSFGQSVFSR